MLCSIISLMAKWFLQTAHLPMLVYLKEGVGPWIVRG